MSIKLRKFVFWVLFLQFLLSIWLMPYMMRSELASIGEEIVPRAGAPAKTVFWSLSHQSPVLLAPVPARY
jgi:hypothetical protein